MEECHIGNMKINLPRGVCSQPDVFRQLLSAETWNCAFSEDERQYFKKFLPSFPENDAQEKEQTTEMLFGGQPFRFGANPLNTLARHLSQGNCTPDVVQRKEVLREVQTKLKRSRRQHYYDRLVPDILQSRRNVLVAAYDFPPNGTTMNLVENEKKEYEIQMRTRKRYFQELSSIRKVSANYACLTDTDASSQSSEDENYPEGPPPKLSRKQRRQRHSMESAFRIPGNGLKAVFSTLSSQYHFPHGDEEVYYQSALKRHHLKKKFHPRDPDINTSSVTMEGIIESCTGGKGLASLGINFGRNSPGTKKQTIETKVKAKKRAPVVVNKEPLSDADESQVKRKVTARRMVTVSAGSLNPLPQTIHPPTLPPPSSVTSGFPATVQKPEALLHVKMEPSEEELAAAVASMSDDIVEISEPVITTPLPAPPEPEKTVTLPPVMQTDDIKPELTQATHACFFSLLRDFMASVPSQRMSIRALKKCLESWLASPISPLNDWYSLVSTSNTNSSGDGSTGWTAALPYALRFLCGSYPAHHPDDFVPYLEWKAHQRAFQWIGAGRDSDANLVPLCQRWLERREQIQSDESSVLSQPAHFPEKPIVVVSAPEIIQKEIPVTVPVPVPVTTSPPPNQLIPPQAPLFPTSWKLRPSTPEEREEYRRQERLRYQKPHRAFTFRLHDYESIVGPVKGVYNEPPPYQPPQTTNADGIAPSVRGARGHSMLVPDRPPYVTILTLVRDAVARLPNGEGTRADICALLRDSQYVCAPPNQPNTASPAQSNMPSADAYLSTVVSGALDRLHGDVDPCVRYDAKRKMWVYLHRARTEEEFERLHVQQQQQLVAGSRPKKSVSRSENSGNKQRLSTAAPTVTTTPIQIKTAVATSPTVTTTTVTTLLARPTLSAEAKPVHVKTSQIANFTSPSEITATTSAGIRTVTLPAGALHGLQLAASAGNSTGTKTIRFTLPANLQAGGKVVPISGTILNQQQTSQQIQTQSRTASVVLSALQHSAIPTAQTSSVVVRAKGSQQALVHPAPVMKTATSMQAAHVAISTGAVVMQNVQSVQKHPVQQHQQQLRKVQLVQTPGTHTHIGRPARMAVGNLLATAARQNPTSLLPQGVAVRLSKNATGGATLIPSTSGQQLAIVAQGGHVLSVATPATGTTTVARNQQSQARMASLQTVTTPMGRKVIVSQSGLQKVLPASGSTALRLMGQSGAGSAGATTFSVAQIGGKPVLLASTAPKTTATHVATQQTSQAQSVFLAPAGAVVPTAARTQLQQQFLLPAGFQAGTAATAIGIKTLHGVKVIPLAHVKGRNQPQQVYARLVSGAAPAAGQSGSKPIVVAPTPTTPATIRRQLPEKHN